MSGDKLASACPAFPDLPRYWDDMAAIITAHLNDDTDTAQRITREQVRDFTQRDWAAYAGVLQGLLEAFGRKLAAGVDMTIDEWWSEFLAVTAADRYSDG